MYNVESTLLMLSNIIRHQNNFNSPHSLRKQRWLGDALVATVSQRRRQSRQPVRDYTNNDNHNAHHAMVNHLEQNANNRLKALKSDRIMTLVSAAPVAKPDRVLDLQSTEIQYILLLGICANEVHNPIQFLLGTL